MGNCLGMIVVSLALVFVTLEFLQCYTNHGDNVTMPNMRGLKLDIVEQKLEALGLRCEVVDTGYIDTYVGDVVLEQSVKPGDKIRSAESSSSPSTPPAHGPFPCHNSPTTAHAARPKPN